MNPERFDRNVLNPERFDRSVLNPVRFDRCVTQLETSPSKGLLSVRSTPLAWQLAVYATMNKKNRSFSVSDSAVSALMGQTTGTGVFTTGNIHTLNTVNKVFPLRLLALLV